MKGRRVTILLGGLTLAVLVLSLPGSLRDAFDRGGIYLFLECVPREHPETPLVNFIGETILLGFKAGAALTIAMTQSGHARWAGRVGALGIPDFGREPGR